LDIVLFLMWPPAGSVCPGNVSVGPSDTTPAL
jgi:hypothetical protein